MADLAGKTPWLYVIGMGADGLESLSAKARHHLDNADVLVSSSRLFKLVPEDGRPRILWESPLRDTLPAIAAHRGKTIAVIATGDPLCYGVGTWLLTKFSLEDMVIIPGTSAFSLTCARMGWAQQKTKLVTLHGRDNGTIRDVISPSQNIVVLSEDASTPKIVADHLQDMGFGASSVSVFTHMDGSDEQRFDVLANQAPEVFDDAFEQNTDHDFNVIAISCVSSKGARVLSRAAGLPDDAFTPFGKMTKRELRALAVAKLAPEPGDVLWDVGAGAASVSVEFLRLAPGGTAHTFDTDTEAQTYQLKNVQNFGLANRITGYQGAMPLQSDNLKIPRPDALFLGGGIGPDVISAARMHLKPGGRLVAHAVTIESEMHLMTAFHQFGGDLTRISVARSEGIGRRASSDSEQAFHGFKPAMTVTQWSIVKECDL